MVKGLTQLEIDLSGALPAVQSRGWVALGRASRELPALVVASAIGEAIPSPKGDVVRELVPKESTHAIPGTLSHLYGKASFPLHSDTAFWPVPARYLVMRVTGDTRRPTIVAPFPSPLDSTIADAISSSVWIIRGVKPFYCSMQFRVGGEVGFRYDPLTMTPANAAALKVHSELPAMLSQVPISTVEWEDVGTVVIDNWRVLHGRGPEPASEGRRVLERIYVR